MSAPIGPRGWWCRYGDVHTPPTGRPAVPLPRLPLPLPPPYPSASVSTPRKPRGGVGRWRHADPTSLEIKRQGRRDRRKNGIFKFVPRSRFSFLLLPLFSVDIIQVAAVFMNVTYLITSRLRCYSFYIYYDTEFYTCITVKNGFLWMQNIFIKIHSWCYSVMRCILNFTKGFFR